MYSLLVSGASGDWDKSEAILDSARFLTFTTDNLKNRFSGLGPKERADLASLPALFAYEAHLEESAFVGRIKTIQVRGSNIRITYERDPLTPPIDPRALMEGLGWDLEIENGELSRSHWAVKNVDLLNALDAAGLLDESSREARGYSRGTLLAAAQVFEGLSHARFDRAILELGIGRDVAGRQLGGLMGRATALGQFLIEHPHMRTPDGKPLGAAIVDRAVSLILSRTVATDEKAVLFLDALQRDGRTIDLSSEPEWLRQSANVEVKENPVSSTPVAKSEVTSTAAKTRVFLVHGHDDAAKNEVARFLERLGLEAVVLHEQPNAGRGVLQKFRDESSTVNFAVILMTPDDCARSLRDGVEHMRARQNVIFELGFFIATLNAANVCALVTEGVERPSDFDDVVYVPYGPGTAWRNELARELRHAGIDFDPTKVFA